MVRHIPARHFSRKIADMPWPDFITDKHGQKFKFRPTDSQGKAARHYMSYFFAEDEEEAGYLSFDDDGDDSLFLIDVVVYKKFSGAGLGQLLIRIVEDEAKRLGKKRIIGDVNAQSHMSGQKERLAAWYRRLGYTVIKRDSVPADYYGPLEKIL